MNRKPKKPRLAFRVRACPYCDNTMIYYRFRAANYICRKCGKSFTHPRFRKRRG